MHLFQVSQHIFHAIRIQPVTHGKVSGQNWQHHTPANLRYDLSVHHSDYLAASLTFGVVAIIHCNCMLGAIHLQ
jgi:hypothetical protein